MEYNLVTGGCGFVGRNVVKRLLATTNSKIVLVDDLSTGWEPARWLEINSEIKSDDFSLINDRVYYFKTDARDFFRGASKTDNLIKWFGGEFTKFNDVFHFAAIVGGRAKIEGDPMMVALDLAIDAEFFYWLVRHKPNRTLYPSSSAAYPIDKQTSGGAIALRETDIDFNAMGQPDMTYGWSKLTGEFLAQTAAQNYGISVTCIRPFSGYGEDQDLSYPVPAIAARAARREDPFEVWGTGDQGRDFVHIDDVIDCILIAMDKVTDGSAINIGSGKLTSFKDLIKLFASFAGYQPTIKPLLEKPMGVHSRYCNMDWVEQNLGWKAKISLEEGMRRVYEAAKKMI